MEKGRWFLLPLLLLFTLGLGYTVLSLPGHDAGLQKMVAEQLDSSGVSNPVTAVLLNFRGYDTLLEIVVLLVALLGVWSLNCANLIKEAASGPVLIGLARVLTPLLVIVSAYLLWVGAHAPGGAFQAGSVLGAAGVLLLLTGWKFRPGFAAFPLRLALLAGPVVFLTVALLTLLLEKELLKYPQAQAGTIILVIETAATISIGVTLTALFLGYRPKKSKENQ